MRRRTLLASLATAAAGTAGCIADSSDPGAPATGGSDPTDASPTDRRTDTRTATDQPVDPPDATDVFADFECPSFSEDPDRTVCYHAAPADPDLLLSAEPEVFDPYLADGDVETLRFVLYNRSGWPVGFNPYDWGIERYDGGEWTHVAPEAYPEPWTEVPAGERFAWALPAAARPAPEDPDVQPVAVALEPGVYAFHVDVKLGSSAAVDTETADAPEETVELVALFRLEESIDPTGEAGTDERTTAAGTPL